MKIIKLEAENIKRLKAVSIKPDGNLVVIGGDNGEGKSSTIDSIAYALGGKSAICDEPIRRGKDKAKVVCDLGDLIVTRTFTKEGGGTLKVATKDGASYSSPQSMLDALVGKLSFDPLAFATMDPKKRLETLKQLVGLDFSELDEKRKRIFDERTAVNREGKSLKARLDEMPEFSDVPEDEVSVSALMEELYARQEINSLNKTKRQVAEDLNETIGKFKNSISDLEMRNRQLQTQLEDEKKELVRLQDQYDNALKAISDLQDADEQEIRDQITNAESINAKVRANRERAELKKQLDAKRAESKQLTNQLEAIDKVKAEALAAAKFPVEGLSFDESGVTYNGIPFDQASDAEKLRVSVAMGIAMNPKLKVLLIRNGSLLDEKNLRMIAEMAAEADAQVWMERVGKGDECQVIIEEGEVKDAKI